MNKQVNLIVSNTYIASFNAVVDKIGEEIKKDKFKNIVLVVPDRFSMNAEQLFFDRLGTSSVFNVWLTTLSRLEKKVLKGYDSSYKFLTKQSGTMLVSKIILNNASKLSTYKNVSSKYSFAEQMFNVINLLKSSNIMPEELQKNINSTNFGLKLKDIYLIYSEYEKALGTDQIDTISKLKLFDDVVKNDDYIKNSEIYFAMFDSFTNSQMSSLCELAKVSRGLNIGVCYNVLQKNKHIYDNVVFQRLKDCFYANSIDCKITFKSAELGKVQNHILNNLFAQNSTTMQSSGVKIVECDNIEAELRYVASKIKYLVMENDYAFDDINVAVNGLDVYSLMAKKIFAEYDLPFYIDESRVLADHYFVKTILQVLHFICDKNSTVDAISISKSPVFNITEKDQSTFENFCYKFNIMGEEFFKPFDFVSSEDCHISESVRAKIFENISHLKTQLEGEKTIFEIVEAIKLYVESLDSKNRILDFANIQTDVVEKRIDEQVYDKFIELLSEAETMFADEKLTKEFAFDMLTSGLLSVKLSTVPLRCNSVFVGDASQSTFAPKKALFVLGSTETKMPSYSVDAGTITDEEIDKFESKSQITPSIKELNRREKFKIFNLLLSYTENLELTYSLLINGEAQTPSEFVTKLSEILSQNGEKLSKNIYSQMPLQIFEEGNSKKLPAYLTGTIFNAVKIAKSNREENATLKFLLQNNLNEILKEQEEIYLQDLNRFAISQARDVLFPNGLTKVSQIERYFNCPFKQFVEYGLRPTKQQKCELLALDVGNILHGVAQKFVDVCIENNFENINTEKLASVCFDKVIAKDDYKNLQNKSYALKSLREEAIRFCKAIKYQIDSSEYKPFATEKRFENIKLPSGLTLKGFVDRVDVCEQNGSYRVIDYKTGKEKFSYYSVYYGLKIQLIVYLKVLEDILQKKPVSAMYMPVKNDFSSSVSSEFEAYKLNGIMLNDQDVIFRTDKHLLTQNKSDIVNVGFKKDRTELLKNSLNTALTNEEFNAIKDYCTNILNIAVDEMLSGYISPKPYSLEGKTSCEYCEYKSLCAYTVETKGHREISTKKQKNSFSKED